MDDGGESSSFPMLCGLVVDAEVVDDARQRVLALRQDLEQIIPAFADEDEFHAVRLARRLTKKEAREAVATGRVPLRDHERAFIYQHALHHLVVLPGRPRLYLVGRVVVGGREEGEPRGTDVRRLTEGLVRYVIEHEDVVSVAVIDEGRQFRHNRSGFTAGAGAKPGAVTGTLRAVDSQVDPLVQMADLVCYAAYQARLQDTQSKQRFPDVHTWFGQSVRSLLPDDVGQSGIRIIG